MSGSHSTVAIFKFTIHDLKRIRLFAPCHDFIRPGLRHPLVKLVAHHHHRRGAATRETFHEFNRELAVLRRLRTMLVRVQAQLFTKMMVQLLAAAQRAAQRAADLDLYLPCGSCRSIG